MARTRVAHPARRAAGRHLRRSRRHSAAPTPTNPSVVSLHTLPDNPRDRLGHPHFARDCRMIECADTRVRFSKKKSSEFSTGQNYGALGAEPQANRSMRQTAGACDYVATRKAQLLALWRAD